MHIVTINIRAQRTEIKDNCTHNTNTTHIDAYTVYIQNAYV